jgi:opacity protein-like surface antigen
MFPLKANLLFRTQFKNGFRTYAGGGIGYVWFDEDDGRIDDDVVYTMLLGVDQEISSKLSLFIEGQYMWLDPDDELHGGSVDMDGFGASAGMNLNF